jgi:hypothetical protein
MNFTKPAQYGGSMRSRESLLLGIHRPTPKERLAVEVNHHGLIVEPRVQGAEVAIQQPGVELTQRRYRGARLDELRGRRAAVANRSHEI